MTEITRLNNWRNKVKIKHLFQEKTTPELIVTLCDALIPQLNSIKNKELKSNLVESDVNYVDNNLTDIIGNFEFLKELANGTVKKKEWKDYCFDGDFEGMFNGYLSELYDLGDARVCTKMNASQKFMWLD